MTRIFDVVNKSNRGNWIFAGDEAEAIEIALAAKVIKTEPKAVHDVTDAWLGKDKPGDDPTRVALDDGLHGWACMQLPEINGRDVIRNLLSPVKPKGTRRWIVSDPRLED